MAATTHLRLFVIVLFSSLILFLWLSLACETTKALELTRVEKAADNTCPDGHTSICQESDHAIWVSQQITPASSDNISSVAVRSGLRINSYETDLINPIRYHSPPDLIFTTSLFDQKTALLFFISGIDYPILLSRSNRAAWMMYQTHS